jgi:hypothetical protein
MDELDEIALLATFLSLQSLTEHLRETGHIFESLPSTPQLTLATTEIVRRKQGHTSGRYR